PGRGARAALPGLGLLAFVLQHAGRAHRGAPRAGGVEPGRAAILRLARAHAAAARPDPARAGAALREVGARGPEPRRLRRLLEAPERGLPPSLEPRARDPNPLRGRLVRLLHARDVPELRRPGSGWAPPRPRAGGPVDARVEDHGALLRGRRGVRSRRRAAEL